MKIFVIEDFLSEDECSKLLFKFNSEYSLKQAETIGNKDGGRNSSVAFIDCIDEIDDKLKSILKEKIHLKGYDVTGLNKYQFTEYKQGDYYHWHVDSSNTIYPNRHYSVVIQLNDDYEGGQLEIKNYEMNNKPQKTGTLFMFPSTTLHRVTPVTYGSRYSLVNWVSLNENSTYKKTLI